MRKVQILNQLSIYYEIVFNRFVSFEVVTLESIPLDVSNLINVSLLILCVRYGVVFLRFVGVVLCVSARESSRGLRFLDGFVCSTCVSDIGVLAQLV
jgi:hypothetical protein